MKLNTLFFSCLCLIGLSSAYGIDNKEQIPLDQVVLADERLQQCLDSQAHEYHWETTKDVTGLYCTHVATLSGIEVFDQLEEFSSILGPITDLSPLVFAKKLRNLTLEDGYIRDLVPLSALKKLEFINLGGNPINDLNDLAELKNLHTIYLFEAKIEDLTPLTGLKHLKRLNVNFNQIHTVGDLSALKELETLDMSASFSSKIDPNVIIPAIKDLKKLKNISLAANRLTDLSVLKEFKALEVIDLSVNQITQLEFLKNKSHLRVLFLGTNLLNKWDYLTDLPALELLYLNHNQFTTIPDDVIDAIALNLPALKEINLYENPIEDCGDLDKLRSALPSVAIISPNHCN